MPKKPMPKPPAKPAKGKPSMPAKGKGGTMKKMCASCGKTPCVCRG